MIIHSIKSRERVSVTAAVATLTAGNIQACNFAEFEVLDAGVTITFDGTDPTDSIGFEFDVHDHFRILGHDALKNFKAIRTGDTSGALEVAYMG